MGNEKQGQLVPYDLVTPGWEAEYTGETGKSSEPSNDLITYSTDPEGNVMGWFSSWGFCHAKEEDWNAEIRLLNSMQAELGHLDDSIRRIRQHIGGLLSCDSGIPVTIDEILNAVGTGQLPDSAFRSGCWASAGTKSTQPHHIESMKAIEDILTGFLDGISKDAFITKYPGAEGFIKRTYDWFGALNDFSELQKLMLKRLLLPFDYFTKRCEDIYELADRCFGEDGEGFKLDRSISELAGLPRIYPINKEEYNTNLNTITDEAKREIYEICGNIAIEVYEMSDCHHNTFRAIENCIYGIGTLRWGIPTRIRSSERKRIGQLIFGYTLGLDRWLQGIPQQFLLLDLGHVDLGFDPKNEILRVYAYLGEDRTPVKVWLAACLWYMLTLRPPAVFFSFGFQHKELIEGCESKGIITHEWIDSKLYR